MRLEPTWKNNRGGDQAISKRLDRFLVSEIFFQDQLVLKTTVKTCEMLDHRPISLSLSIPEDKPPSPFKFDLVWLENEEYRALVQEKWKPLGNHSSKSFMYQMTENLTNINKISKEWGKKHKARQQ